MNWSWNHGDPYMRGWGGVIFLGLYAVPVLALYITRRVRGRW